MKGVWIIIVGPSGSGKGTLISHLKETHPEFTYAISCTTRAPREGEKDGAPYFFLSQEEFESKVQAGAFLEHAGYDANRYGTLKNQVLPTLEKGAVVVKEMEVQGARIVRDTLPRENLFYIFIDVGSKEKLKERILGRGAMSEESMARRFKHFDDEITFRAECDAVVNNEGILEDTVRDFDLVIEKLIASHEGA